MRLEPLKKDDIKLDRSPAYRNSRGRYDVSKSYDASSRGFNKSLTIGEVAGTQVLIKWGVDSYNTPIINHKYEINNTIVKNSPRESFADVHALRRSWIPGPGEHIGHSDWFHMLSGQTGVSPKAASGCFMKKNKITLTA